MIRAMSITVAVIFTDENDAENKCCKPHIFATHFQHEVENGSKKGNHDDEYFQT